jgi:hypothetical protein
MKTKLLKKTRKRFEIIHMPKGFTSCGIRYEFNLFRLTDSTNDWYERYSQLGKEDCKTQFCIPNHIFKTEKECIEHLQKMIISRLRDEGHLSRKDYVIKKLHKKVWYK